MKVSSETNFHVELLLAAAIVLFSQIVPAWGLVLHPDGEPNMADWTERPDANVVGRWSTNASFAVIAPNWVITTRHQGTSPTEVVINGVSYPCQYDAAWTGGAAGTADIRLIRLSATGGGKANLANYAKPYELNDEVGKDIVIGGYGKGRGASLITTYRGKDYVYGYQWQASGNTVQRWCQNIIDGVGTAGGTYTSAVIDADFDGLGDDTWRPYEGIIAAYDSGGGWFIYDGGEWRVAGLSRGIEHADESWFRNNLIPTALDPDGFDAVRISTYAEWISGIIYVTGDLTGDEWVDFIDFSVLANNWQRDDCSEVNNWCNGADFEPHDGIVDWTDLGFMADNWLTGWPN